MLSRARHLGLPQPVPPPLPYLYPTAQMAAKEVWLQFFLPKQGPQVCTHNKKLKIVTTSKVQEANASPRQAPPTHHSSPTQIPSLALELLDTTHLKKAPLQNYSCTTKWRLGKPVLGHRGHQAHTKHWPPQTIVSLRLGVQAVSVRAPVKKREEKICRQRQFKMHTDPHFYPWDAHCCAFFLGCTGYTL